MTGKNQTTPNHLPGGEDMVAEHDDYAGPGGGKKLW
jgi:hypothetical protein